MIILLDARSIVGNFSGDALIPKSPMLSNLCYLFEAKGIQRYVFASNRLRDVIAASDLVASLASSEGSDALSEILEVMGLTTGAVFSRRAGGSFAIHLGERAAAQRLRALWRVTVGLRCPGLEYVDSIGEGETELQALESAYGGLGAVRDNGPAGLLPPANGLFQLNPRSGRAVMAWQRHSDGEADPLDTLTFAQRRYGESDGARDRVAGRFTPPEHRGKVRFPRQLDEDGDDKSSNPVFPFDPDSPDRRLALIHADLSGLGQIFRDATNPQSGGSATHVYKIATAIENVVVTAAQDATRDILLPLGQPDATSTGGPILPARPVLLGGDDITIVMRADAAVPWAEHFLKGVETLSKAELARQKATEPEVFGNLPTHLSACAGVAIMRGGSPFLLLNTLAEQLCKAAKDVAKAGNQQAPYPSLLTFQVRQSTLNESYYDSLERELTPISASNHLPAVRLTGGPYAVAENNAVARPLAHLIRLANALANAPRGRSKWIEAGAQLFKDSDKAPQKAMELVKRWTQVLRHEDRQSWQQVADAIAAFGGDVSAKAGLDAMARKTLDATFGPVMDALEVIDIGAADVWEQATKLNGDKESAAA